MRKQIAILLSVVFLVSLNITANAAVKPGTSCKKLGSISISSGKKFICVKSGKKLIWNKGKNFNTVEAKPAPDETPTATPTASTLNSENDFLKFLHREGESCNLSSDTFVGISSFGELIEIICNGYDNKFIYKKNGLTIDQLSGRPVDKSFIVEEQSYRIIKLSRWTNYDYRKLEPISSSILKLNADVTWQLAIHDLDLYFRNAQPFIPKYIKEIGLNSVLSDVNRKFNLLSNAQRFWSTNFKPNEILVFLFNKGDGVWAEEIAIKYGLQVPVEGLKFLVDSNCSFGTANISSQGIPYVRTCATFNNSFQNDSVIIHEYTHLVQHQKNYFFPEWLSEGSANFYGYAINAVLNDPTGEKYNLALIAEANRGDLLPELREALRNNDYQYIAKSLKDNEYPTPGLGASKSKFGYYFTGAIATEALVATYGHNKFSEFLMSFTQDKNWKIEFKSIFGIDVDEFYEKVSPYICKRFIYLNE